MAVTEKRVSTYLPLKPDAERDAEKALYMSRVAARRAAEHAVGRKLRQAQPAPAEVPVVEPDVQQKPTGQSKQDEPVEQVASPEPELKPESSASQAVTPSVTTAQMYGSFMLDQEEFALPALSIREVVNFPERLVPVPLSPPYLEGIFTLRGMVIPVVNLRRLFDPAAAKADTTQKIAIVDHEQIQVGLLFDSTGEILRVRPEQHSILQYSGKNAQGVISGTIQTHRSNGIKDVSETRDDDSRLLQILDPFALLHIENIPQVLERRNAGRKAEASRFQLQAERRQCVSFHVGGSVFAFEMAAIREIINVPELQSSVLNSKLCAGSFHFRGGIVPVVNFATLLKAGDTEQTLSADSRLVIARIGTVSVGFLVDSVDDIIKFFPDDVLPIPLLSKARAGMYRGCILRPDNDEVILLNHESIFSSTEIVDMNRGHAHLFQDKVQTTEEVRKKVNRQVYLTFRLDNAFAVEIRQVREIIEYSDNINKPPGMPSFMRGILNLRQQMITVVDMRSLYGMPPLVSQRDAKILILERGDERFGLVVDGVESIVTVSDSDRYPLPKMMTYSMPPGLRGEMDEVIDLPGEGEARQTFSVFQRDVFLARLARET
jgi:purine-binding chemotaxis protein CheW